jgi:hypothetical protein
VIETGGAFQIGKIAVFVTNMGLVIEIKSPRR